MEPSQGFVGVVMVVEGVGVEVEVRVLGVGFGIVGLRGRMIGTGIRIGIGREDCAAEGGGVEVQVSADEGVGEA